MKDNNYIISFQSSKYNGISLLEELDFSEKSNLKSFEIFFDDYLPDALTKNEFDKIVEMKKRGWEFSVHSPIYSYKNCENYIKKIIDFCNRIEAKLITVHFNLLSYDIIEYFLNNLKKTKLSIENVIPDNNPIYNNNYIEYMKEVNLKYKVYSTLDVGHLVVNNYEPVDYIDKLIKNNIKILSVHLHDNFFKSDEHLPLGEGAIDYSKVLNVLFNLRIYGPYIIEHWNGNEISLNYFNKILHNTIA